MASLNVTQDDMIDILIGHANAGLPMNAEEHDPPSPPQSQPTPDPPATLENEHQSYQETFTELRPPSLPPPPQPHPPSPPAAAPAPPVAPTPPSQSQHGHHNQYLCPGCQQSILYTNRSSLVQLLSLHQQKCTGSQHYRYMCLECHSAFRTVVSLQEHESTCGVGPVHQGTKTGQNDNKRTEGVIQSLGHGINRHTSDGMNNHTTGFPPFGNSNELNDNFFNNESTEHGKTVENQNGAIQNADDKDDDYKLPSSFYRPDSVDTKGSITTTTTGQLCSSTGVIQTTPDLSKPTLSGGEHSNKRPEDMKEEKDDDLVHSMSEKSYEQPNRSVGTREKVQVDCKVVEEGTHQEEGDSTVERIYVRESWSQTYDQPKAPAQAAKTVDCVLDEVSPAGRKRRACTRKMKVYNEKEMVEQREAQEMESLSQLTLTRNKRIMLRKQKILETKQAREAKERENPPVRKKRPYKKRKGKDGVPVEKEKKPPREPKPKKERKKREKKVKEKEPELAIPMQCAQCPKTFTRYSLYTKHYQMNHERAMCQYCGSQCIRRKLKSHEAAHLRQFKCTYPGCSKVVNSKHRLIRHTRIHTGEKPYLCEICNKPFAGKENMVKHRKRVHEGEKPYQCRFCGRKFADTGRLKYHEGTHTKPRPTDYLCKFCGRGYKSHVGCYLHERTHTGNTVKCQYCGKAFMAKEHLKRHEYLHTGNYPFRCGNCQKGFKDHGSMRKHKCLAVL